MESACSAFELVLTGGRVTRKFRAFELDNGGAPAVENTFDLGGVQAMAETFRAIPDVGRWWP